MLRHSLILLFCALSAPLTSAEPIVSTSYEIRHEIQELLDDLSQKRGDHAALLDRAQNALATHGDLLFVHQGTALPIGELINSTLSKSGLDQEFITTFTSLAERRLLALDTHAPAINFRTLALGFPGTPAAQSAWQRLADRAWDAGDVSSYLSFAQRAHDHDDPTRRSRVDAAMILLTAPARASLPSDFVHAEELWRVDLGEPPVNTTPRARTREQPINSVAIATGTAEISAVSDGFRLRVFDHVVGRLSGDDVLLGNQPLRAAQMQPAPLKDGFVAVGMLSDQVHMVAIDTLGHVRWQQSLPQRAQASISAPVVLDNLVIFSVITNLRDGADLQVMALYADSGRTAWTSQIARLSGVKSLFMNGNMVSQTVPPAITSLNGTLIVSSNNGIIARIGADGAVQRVWSYPSIYDDLNTVMASRSGPRAGTLMSDDRTAVATPADAPNTVIVLNNTDAAPRFYSGDNANGEVIDVHDDVALLIGRRATLVDLSTLKPRWTVPCDGDGVVVGHLSGERALLAGRGRMTLLNVRSGAVLTQNELPQLPISINVIDDALLIAQNWTISGRGHGESFLDRLTAATQRQPDDFRPLVALASLFEARNDRGKAFAHLIEALKRHAPTEYAERAARLIRQDLELLAGDRLHFLTSLTQLEVLASFDTRLETEITWWKARHAELIGDKNDALSFYRSVLTMPTRALEFSGALSIDAHTLAEAGLARLQTNAQPSWYNSAHIETLATTPTITPWTSPGSVSPRILLNDRLIISQNNGLLTARNLADGHDIWWRQSERALLGVSWNGLVFDEAPMAGVPPPQHGLVLNVMPGSAAAAAGMRSGDRMLTFNGKPTTNMDRDLRSVVLTMQPRAPFTVELERKQERLVVHGTLGGDMVEPIGIGSGVVLVWPLAYLPGTNRPLPEGMWFSAHDLSNGQELWRWSLPPITAETAPIAPLITERGLIITQDGGDLVALEVHSTPMPNSEGPNVRWRIAGAALNLTPARLLTPDLLWLPLSSHNHVAIVDVNTGLTRFKIPVSSKAQVLIADGELAVRDNDSRPVLWDLTIGKQRWRGEACAALLAFCGDGLLILDDTRRPAIIDRTNGALRRSIGDWAMVEDWRITPKTVFVHARREGVQNIAAISIPGATVRWETELSPRAEIKTLLINQGLIGCIIADVADRESVLLIDEKGTPRSTLLLEPGDAVAATFADGSALIQSTNDLHVAPPSQTTIPAPLPLLIASPQDNLSATAQAVLPQLQWQTIGQARFALARVKNNVLVFADLPPNGPSLDIMLSDNSSLFEIAGSPLRFTPDGPVFSVVAGSWLMGGTARLEHNTGFLRRDCVRLDPPPGRLPTHITRVRASYGNLTNATVAPWWLHAAWQVLP